MGFMLNLTSSSSSKDGLGGSRAARGTQRHGALRYREPRPTEPSARLVARGGASALPPHRGHESLVGMARRGAPAPEFRPRSLRFEADSHLAGGWISVLRLDGCATVRRILEETTNQRVRRELEQHLKASGGSAGLRSSCSTSKWINMGRFI